MEKWREKDEEKENQCFSGIYNYYVGHRIIAKYSIEKKGFMNNRQS